MNLGYEYVIPPENATLNGAIETLSDARKCAETFQKNRTRIDGIIVCLPNFSGYWTRVMELIISGDGIAIRLIRAVLWFTNPRITLI